ncbi:MAG: response regulator [Ignavibacteriota bacterium]
MIGSWLEIPRKQFLQDTSSRRWDDDFRVRESIESLVASAGHTPLVFASAEEFLQSGAPALAICLITDVRMPGIDGLELLQRRVRLQHPGLAVIFITAHYDDEIRKRALSQGRRGIPAQALRRRGFVGRD